MTEVEKVYLDPDPTPPPAEPEKKSVKKKKKSVKQLSKKKQSKKKSKKKKKKKSQLKKTKKSKKKFKFRAFDTSLPGKTVAKRARARKQLVKLYKSSLKPSKDEWFERYYKYADVSDFLPADKKFKHPEDVVPEASSDSKFLDMSEFLPETEEAFTPQRASSPKPRGGRTTKAEALESVAFDVVSNYCKYTKNGELIYDNRVIPGSNIFKLGAAYLTGKSKPNLPGWQEFAACMPGAKTRARAPRPGPVYSRTPIITEIPTSAERQDFRQNYARMTTDYAMGGRTPVMPAFINPQQLRHRALPDPVDSVADGREDYQEVLSGSQVPTGPGWLEPISFRPSTSKVHQDKGRRRAITPGFVHPPQTAKTKISKS